LTERETIIIKNIFFMFYCNSHQQSNLWYKAVRS